LTKKLNVPCAMQGLSAFSADISASLVAVDEKAEFPRRRSTLWCLTKKLNVPDAMPFAVEGHSAFSLREKPESP